MNSIKERNATKHLITGMPSELGVSRLVFIAVVRQPRVVKKMRESILSSRCVEIERTYRIDELLKNRIS